MALTDVKSEQIQSSVALAGSPTTTTQSASDNSTKIATTAYVDTAVTNLVASAPAALNTLDELAAALNDDASFSTTITNSIATKAPLASPTFTGTLTVPTLITGAYGAGGSAGDGFRLNSTDLYGQVDASDKVRIAVAANSFFNGGNVGIGTTSPKRQLHIHNTASTSTKIQITNAATGSSSDGDGLQLSIGNDGTGFLEQRENKDLVFTTNNTEAMRINNSRTVGIGTTDLHTWATFDGRLRVGARAFFGTTSGSTQVGYNWYYDGAYKYIAGDYANRYIQNDGHHWWQNAVVGSADGALSWVSVMRLDRDGRLTLGPDYLDIQIDPASTNSGNNLLYMRGNASGDKSQIQLNHYGHADYHIGVGHVANGTFNIANNQTGNDFVIDSTGRIGINRTPSITNSKLEVGGADNVPLINVEASGNTAGIGIGSGYMKFYQSNSEIARMSLGSADKYNGGNSPGFSGNGGNLRLSGDDSQIIMANNLIHSDNSGNTTFTIRAAYGAVSADARLNIDSGFITFRTGTSFTERMRISTSSTYPAFVGVNGGNGALIVNDTGAETSFYSTGSHPGIGLYTDGAYASCGAHMEIASNAAVGWSPIYINKYNVGSSTDARWLSFGVNGYNTDSATISYNYSTGNFSLDNASDYRIKENVVNYSGGLEKIDALRVVSYNKINSTADTKIEGFIAHELQEIIPAAVKGEKDAMKVNEEGETVPDYQMLSKETLVPYLVSAIQELSAKVKELESK